MLFRSKQLQAITEWVNDYFYVRAVSRWGNEGVDACVVAIDWKNFASWGMKFYLRSIWCFDGVGCWVEVQSTSECKCNYRVGAGDKTERVCRTIISLWKVAVE